MSRAEPYTRAQIDEKLAWAKRIQEQTIGGQVDLPAAALDVLRWNATVESVRDAVAAVIEYAQHQPSCVMFDIDKPRAQCDCGFLTALAELRS